MRSPLLMMLSILHVFTMSSTFLLKNVANACATASSHLIEFFPFVILLGKESGGRSIAIFMLCQKPALPTFSISLSIFSSSFFQSSLCILFPTLLLWLRISALLLHFAFVNRFFFFLLNLLIFRGSLDVQSVYIMYLKG